MRNLNNMDLQREKSMNRQKFLFMAGFLALFLLLWFGGLDRLRIPRVTPFEFIILSLSSFRLTRLFVYDGVMQFFRDLFFVQKQVADQVTHEVVVERAKPDAGPKRAVAELLSCPWCVGIWTSLAVIVLYTLFPSADVFLMVLAIAGASSCIQISMNAIGWRAEKEKTEVTHNESDEKKSV